MVSTSFCFPTWVLQVSYCGLYKQPSWEYIFHTYSYYWTVLTRYEDLLLVMIWFFGPIYTKRMQHMKARDLYLNACCLGRWAELRASSSTSWHQQRTAVLALPGCRLFNGAILEQTLPTWQPHPFIAVLKPCSKVVFYSIVGLILQMPRFPTKTELFFANMVFRERRFYWIQLFSRFCARPMFSLRSVPSCTGKAKRTRFLHLLSGRLAWLPGAQFLFMSMTFIHSFCKQAQNYFAAFM